VTTAETDKPRNMQALTYDVETLLARIKANRDAHREVYEKAMTGYQRAAGDFFHEQLERARASKPFQTMFNEPMPEDHSEDYEAIIDLLTLSEDTVVSLSIQEFRQYVRDDWGWKREFMATSQNYLAQR
jgi:hypothetical protein